MFHFVSNMCCSKCFYVTSVAWPGVESGRRQRWSPRACGKCNRRGAPTRMHKHVRTKTAGEAGLAGVATAAATERTQVWQQHAGGRAGATLHALWGLPRQSGRSRCGARIPSIGHMHLGKCVACVVFLPHAERARQGCRWAVGVGVRTNTASGH
jgi:hypothetical protein